jgi:hypothetical protein
VEVGVTRFGTRSLCLVILYGDVKVKQAHKKCWFKFLLVELRAVASWGLGTNEAGGGWRAIGVLEQPMTLYQLPEV